MTVCGARRGLAGLARAQGSWLLGVCRWPQAPGYFQICGMQSLDGHHTLAGERAVTGTVWGSGRGGRWQPELSRAGRASEPAATLPPTQALSKDHLLLSGPPGRVWRVPSLLGHRPTYSLRPFSVPRTAGVWTKPRCVGLAGPHRPHSAARTCRAVNQDRGPLLRNSETTTGASLRTIKPIDSKLY